MIHVRDYIQQIDNVDHISISKWGMFPIVIPTFKEEREDDTDIRQAVKEDFFFAMPMMMRQMKRFKEEIASYANRLGCG